MRKVRNEVIIALLICIIKLVYSDIVSRNFGEVYSKCVNRALNQKKSIRYVIGTKLHFYCKSIDDFQTSHQRDFPGKRLAQHEEAWCMGLLDRSEQQRFKRQADKHGPGHNGRGNRRQEYRTLSDRRRKKYHAAIKQLKHTMIGNSSQYDILARLHTGITQITAHGGCNFLGWHRVYLNMYEAALQLKDPSVTLPYWDSTLDNYMPREDQERSILWGDDFLGTPHGTVTTGFAANWTSGRFGPLTRNVGRANGAALMSDEEIAGVINKTRMSEICGDNSAIDNDLEFIHGPPHIFVDGQMGNIESAAYEPAFYMHHAFIDLLWELFRENSERAGIDVENDYPEQGFGDMFHGGNRQMGLGNRTIKEGLLKRQIRGKFFYAPRPTCSMRRRKCPGKYLKCVLIGQRPKCISKTIKEVEDDNTKPTTPTPTEPPVECPKPTYPYNPYSEQTAIQNTFCANGKSDTNEWVYLPIQIMTARPPDYSGYNSYRVKNGQPDRSDDVYNPQSYGELKTYIRPGRPKTFHQCHTENTTAGRIFIQSDGLNYEGSYKDFAIVDTRLAISISITYVAIKDPEKTFANNRNQLYKYSDVLLTAFDSCGRMCRANCLVPNENPPLYRPCTGAIRVTPNAFKKNFYGRDYGGASASVWDFARDRRCPQFKTDQIFVSFYCDYSNRWPWALDAESQITAPNRPPPGLNLSPPAPIKPVLKECSVPIIWNRAETCIIEREDCRAPCNSPQKFKCKDKCDEYADCNGSRISVKMCNYRQRFDIDNCVAMDPQSSATCPAAYDYGKRLRAARVIRRLNRRRGRGRGRPWRRHNRNHNSGF